MLLWNTKLEYGSNCSLLVGWHYDARWDDADVLGCVGKESAEAAMIFLCDEREHVGRGNQVSTRS